MGRKVQLWRWAVSVSDMDDVHGVLISTHVACSVCISESVTNTLEGWDLDVFTSLFPWQFILDRNFLLVLGRQARQLFLSCSLFDSGRAGLLVSFPEGMVSCRPGQAVELELRVFNRVVCILQCGCGCMGRRIPPWRRTASAGLLVSFPEGMVSCNPGHALVLVTPVFC